MKGPRGNHSRFQVGTTCPSLAFPVWLFQALSAPILWGVDLPLQQISKVRWRNSGNNDSQAGLSNCTQDSHSGASTCRSQGA